MADEVKVPTAWNEVSEEYVMRRFVGMCQQSLSPRKYELLLEICGHLCVARTKGLRPDSLDRCLGELHGHEDPR